jgi:hypothetical protein
MNYKAQFIDNYRIESLAETSKALPHSAGMKAQLMSGPIIFPATDSLLLDQILVQLPKSEYLRLQKASELPMINRAE